MNDERKPPEQTPEEPQPANPEVPDPGVEPPPFDYVTEGYNDRSLQKKGLDQVLKEIKSLKLPE